MYGHKDVFGETRKWRSAADFLQKMRCGHRAARSDTTFSWTEDSLADFDRKQKRDSCSQNVFTWLRKEKDVN